MVSSMKHGPARAEGRVALHLGPARARHRLDPGGQADAELVAADGVGDGDGAGQRGGAEAVDGDRRHRVREARPPARAQRAMSPMPSCAGFTHPAAMSSIRSSGTPTRSQAATIVCPSRSSYADVRQRAAVAPHRRTHAAEDERVAHGDRSPFASLARPRGRQRWPSAPGAGNPSRSGQDTHPRPSGHRRPDSRRARPAAAPLGAAARGGAQRRGALAETIHVEAGARSPSGPANSERPARPAPRAPRSCRCAARSPARRRISPAGTEGHRPKSMASSTSLPIRIGRSQRYSEMSP